MDEDTDVELKEISADSWKPE